MDFLDRLAAASPCTCGHPRRDHHLDFDRSGYGVDPDCRHYACYCLDFTPEAQAAKPPSGEVGKAIGGAIALWAFVQFGLPIIGAILLLVLIVASR